MAITVAGTAAFNTVAGAGSETKTLPGSPVENDIVLVVGASDVQFSFPGVPNVTPGLTTTGYTQLYDTGGFTPGFWVGYKRMGSTPDTEVVFAQDNTDRAAYAVYVLRGVSTTIEFDLFTESTAPYLPLLVTGATGLPNAPSVTTITDNALVVAVGSLDDDDDASNITAPSGYSNLIAADTGQASTTVGATAMIASKIVATAGVEDPAAFGGTGSDDWAAATLVFRDAAAGDLYWTDFSEYTNAVQPSDWTRRHIATATWVVAADGGATGGKVLQYSHVSDGQQQTLTWDAIDSDQARRDVDILLRVRWPTTAANGDMRAYDRGSGTGSGIFGYVLGKRPESPFERIGRFDNGSFAQLANNTNTGAADTWYWMRARSWRGFHYLKVWTGTSGDEPGTWTLESAANTDIQGVGWVGLYAFRGGACDIDLFSVATGGQVASFTDPDAGGGGGGGTGNRLIMW